MKRYRLIGILFISLWSINAFPHEFKYNGIKYQVLSEEEMTVEVIGYSESSPKVYIPQVAIDYEDNKKLYTVTEIGDWAFYWDGWITSVKIPATIKRIGELAFNNCKGLSEIVLPDSVKSIGREAFGECENLESVIFGNMLESIGTKAFYGCSALTELTLPDSMIKIDDYAFYECSNFLHIQLPGSLKTIGKNAFKNCDKLKKIKLPDSVITIEEYAFYGCNSINEIIFGNALNYIGRSAFSECSGLTTVNLPDSVKYIGEDAFSDCNNLSLFTMGNSVEYIGENAFYKSAIRTIDIPASVSHIAHNSFSRADFLCDINIDTANPYFSASEGVIYNKDFTTVIACAGGIKKLIIANTVTCIPDKTFAYTNFEEIKLGNSIEYIGSHAFEGSKISTIDLPASVTQIGSLCFAFTKNLLTINVDSQNEYFSSSDGVLYDKDFTIALDCGKGIESVIFPKTLRYINDSAFKGAENLHEIEFPDSLISIGKYAFYDCRSMKLKNIIIPHVITIDNWAFYNCSWVENIELPANISEIGLYAFDSDPSVKIITCHAETPPYCVQLTFYSYDPHTLNYTPCMAISKVIINVPQEAIPLYKNAPGWNIFKNFEPIESAGVEAVEGEEEPEYYRVFDLQGRKVLETRSRNDVNSLPKGIYIVNGKKIAL